jgi:hypothetical protein
MPVIVINPPVITPPVNNPPTTPVTIKADPAKTVINDKSN